MKDEPGKQRDIVLAMRCGGIRLSKSEDAKKKTSLYI